MELGCSWCLQQTNSQQRAVYVLQREPLAEQQLNCCTPSDLL